MCGTLGSKTESHIFGTSFEEPRCKVNQWTLLRRQLPEGEDFLVGGNRCAEESLPRLPEGTGKLFIALGVVSTVLKIVFRHFEILKWQNISIAKSTTLGISRLPLVPKSEGLRPTVRKIV